MAMFLKERLGALRGRLKPASAMGAQGAAVRELAAVLGPGEVLQRAEDVIVYEYDYGLDRGMPDLVVSRARPSRWPRWRGWRGGMGWRWWRGAPGRGSRAERWRCGAGSWWRWHG
jgi:hypothetical protein